ncbi:hypothetical protein OHA74_54985 [Streptomyces phaeochromogenes]|uniref:hypothetical protein n=1 Tax=Streptomyces phaeochromogenes TaxID=1923 RepID=UPI002E283F82|nr:hypothetical protein [Streptomyces phaeochromogenes]
MGRRIHALTLPVARRACRWPASRIRRAVRVDNAARDGVPDTGSTGSSDQRI